MGDVDELGYGYVNEILNVRVNVRPRLHYILQLYIFMSGERK